MLKYSFLANEINATGCANKRLLIKIEVPLHKTYYRRDWAINDFNTRKFKTVSSTRWTFSGCIRRNLLFRNAAHTCFNVKDFLR